MGLRTARAAAVIAFTAAQLTLATSTASADASTFVRLINRERSKAGLSSLAVRSDLTAEARAHSARMARAGKIFHDYSMGDRLCCWSRFGENVGFGPNASEIHDHFMDSAPHRANILGRFNQVGVGIAWRGDALYVTQVFVLRRSAPAPVVRTRAPEPQPPPRAASKRPRRRPRPVARMTVSMLTQLVALDDEPEAVDDVRPAFKPG